MSKRAFVEAAEPLQRSHGELRIAFKRRGSTSALCSLFQDGCLKARLPRAYGRAPEAVCINTSGGLTDGDELRTEVIARHGASGVVSAQAAERIYRSRGEPARIKTSLVLEPAAMLGWLPQEMIVFDGGRVSRQLRVVMPSTATLLAVEASVLGRTAMGETVRTGSLSERWHIEIDGQLAFVDALCLDDDDLDINRHRPAVLDGALAFASILFVGADTKAVRDAIRKVRVDAAFGASDLDGIVLCRVAAATGMALRTALIRILTVILDRYDDLHLPKVWTL